MSSDERDDLDDDAEGPSLTAEGMRALIEQRMAITASQVMGILQLLAPHVPADVALQIAQGTAQEQFGPIMQEILPTLADPDAVAKHPTLIVRVGKPGEDLAAVVKSPKRLERVSDCGVAAQSAMVLALVLCPEARAILRAFGFTYAFMQSAEAPGGQIILSS